MPGPTSLSPLNATEFAILTAHLNAQVVGFTPIFQVERDNVIFIDKITGTGDDQDIRFAQVDSNKHYNSNPNGVGYISILTDGDKLPEIQKVETKSSELRDLGVVALATYFQDFGDVGNPLATGIKCVANVQRWNNEKPDEKLYNNKWYNGGREYRSTARKAAARKFTPDEWGELTSRMITSGFTDAFIALTPAQKEEEVKTTPVFSVIT